MEKAKQRQDIWLQFQQTDHNFAVVRTRAPGNDAAIGGLKVITSSGWFAARPSGTENIYKIYAESFKDLAHLNAIVNDAQRIASNSLS